MPIYSSKLTEVSALGDFETEVDKLMRQMRAGRYTTPEEFNQSNIGNTGDYSYSSILVDNGKNRITSGLKALELISIMVSGTAPQNLFLFDNVIYVGTANDFKTANDSKLVELVLQNIGMSDIVESLSDQTTAQLRDKCLRVANLVKTGNYTSDIYSSYIKKESKRILNLYLENQS